LYYDISDNILGYYNSTDFDITDYYTKTNIDDFSYYNSTDFLIEDYATSIELTSVGNWSEDKGDYSTTAEANTLYYDIDDNVLSYWNSTYSDFNKTYGDTLYADISVTGDNATWNETYADTLYAQINYGDDWNKTYADTLYYDIDNNVLSYWNSTYADFNKTYSDTLYKDKGITTWNDTFALFNKTYGDTLYYDLGNSYSYYNSTSLTMSVVQALGYYNTTQTDNTFITQANEGNLNVKFFRLLGYL